MAFGEKRWHVLVVELLRVIAAALAGFVGGGQS